MNIRELGQKIFGAPQQKPDAGIRIPGAHVIIPKTGQIYGGEGTITIIRGDTVFVGQEIPVEKTIISPPPRE